MRTIKCIFCALFTIFMIAACDNNTESDLNSDLQSSAIEQDVSNKSHTVTLPFKGKFTVMRAMDPVVIECGLQESMIGAGTLTHLGKMSTTMLFCVDLSDLSYSFLEDGAFVAANGDELYFRVDDGQILFGDYGYYQGYFNDEVVFTGGTGRFEGATGSIFTNAYVHSGTPGNESDPFHTDFSIIEGSITLNKGK
ncbi:hypothetical protein [Robertkochia solimangrovi]|uniref:hypothetical protein n=1 Tax=Robertkochia solimangrovi TaxID=2213046 RepID=UPI0011805F42|nr:hypothetical protein [Robertkochia solimangrovi]